MTLPVWFLRAWTPKAREMWIFHSFGFLAKGETRATRMFRTFRIFNPVNLH